MIKVCGLELIQSITLVERAETIDFNYSVKHKNIKIINSIFSIFPTYVKGTGKDTFTFFHSPQRIQGTSTSTYL